MGRHRRLYPQGKLRLRYPKENYDKSKEYPLYFEYTWLSSAPIRKQANLKVKVEAWNEAKNELTAKFGSNYKWYNQSLRDKLSKYDTQIREYAEKHNNDINAENIRDILNESPITRSDEGRDFIDYAATICEQKYASRRIKMSRLQNGYSALYAFQEFLVSQNKGTKTYDLASRINSKKKRILDVKNSIYLSEISESLVCEFVEYKRNVKRNTDETINHALTPIIMTCEKARDDGFISSKVFSSIKDCRISIKPRIDADSFDGKAALTKEELLKLIDFYEQDTEPRRKEYLEMFLFAFHAGGLRMVDVMTLQWKSVFWEKREIDKVLVKTAKRHTVPLTDAALKILKKWQRMARRQRFVFDLVPDDFELTDEGIYLARNNSNKKINQALSVVAEKVGLPNGLSFHYARHTFATLALNDKMDISIVSRILGHGSTSVTEQVYAEYLPKTLSAEMDRLNYDFLPNLD